MAPGTSTPRQRGGCRGTGRSGGKFSGAGRASGAGGSSTGRGSPRGNNFSPNGQRGFRGVRSDGGGSMRGRGGEVLKPRRGGSFYEGSGRGGQQLIRKSYSQGDEYNESLEEEQKYTKPTKKNPAGQSNGHKKDLIVFDSDNDEEESGSDESASLLESEDEDEELLSEEEEERNLKIKTCEDEKEELTRLPQEKGKLVNGTSASKLLTPKAKTPNSAQVKTPNNSKAAPVPASLDDEGDDDSENVEDSDEYESDQNEEGDSVFLPSRNEGQRDNVKTPTSAQVNTPKDSKATPAVGSSSEEDDYDFLSEEDGDESMSSSYEEEGHALEKVRQDVSVVVRKASQKKTAQSAGPVQKAFIEKNKQEKRNSSDLAAGPASKKQRNAVNLISADDKILTEEEQRIKQRDKRTLFVKNLPKNCRDEDLKAIAPDTLTVRRHHQKSRFAWLMFASEQICAKNYEKLKAAKIAGRFSFYVDFCGDKSDKINTLRSTQDRSRENVQLNSLKLYLGGIPAGTTEDELMKIFPKCVSVSIARSSKNAANVRRIAFVTFSIDGDTRSAFDANRSLKLKGIPVDVLYAKVPALKATASLAKKAVANSQLNSSKNPQLSTMVNHKTGSKTVANFVKGTQQKKPVAAEIDYDDEDEDNLDDEDLEEDDGDHSNGESE